MNPDEVTAAATGPPEPLAPPSAPFAWERFERYPNAVAAHIIAGLLESEGVPAIVTNNCIIPGITEYVSLLVPKHLAHRARWILALHPPSEAELVFLSTGELPHET